MSELPRRPSLVPHVFEDPRFAAHDRGVFPPNKVTQRDDLFAQNLIPEPTHAVKHQVTPSPEHGRHRNNNPSEQAILKPHSIGRHVAAALLRPGTNN